MTDTPGQVTVTFNVPDIDDAVESAARLIIPYGWTVDTVTRTDAPPTVAEVAKVWNWEQSTRQTMCDHPRVLYSRDDMPTCEDCGYAASHLGQR